MSFLAVVVVLLTLTLPPPGADARDSRLWKSIGDGFRFVRREPGLRVTALAMCLNTFLAAPFIAGGIAGGLAGTYSARHLSERRGVLNTVFAAVIILAALYMLARNVYPS